MSSLPGAAAFGAPVVGIPVGGAPPAYATVGAPMLAEDIPAGAARYDYHGPGREYDSGILRQIAGAGSWRNPHEYDKVCVNVSSLANGTPSMIVDKGEPQYFQTEVGWRLVPSIPCLGTSSRRFDFSLFFCLLSFLGCPRFMG